ncbi:MAG TPA: hypothetical protein VM409_01140, partial [Chloroflexia bacterium]|nr:hypothetical protein [Chloroflexia bacterium]
MKRRWTVLLSLLLLVLQGQAAGALYTAQPVTRFGWPPEWQADSAFYGTWATTDAPVAAGKASRSWLWGPVPFAVANEEYAESSTGRRLVEYMDKARMEVNDPLSDHKSKWYVTSGLLVNELVTGQVQTGNSTFQARTPSDLPVAGDANSPNAPAYATFAGLRGRVAKALGSLAKQRLQRDGTLVALRAPEVPSDAKLFGMALYDDVTGHHIPGVFADWMRQSGTVLAGGYFVQAPLMDPLFVLGRPITEAYWADVLVGGAPARVLVQLYERRALTYNPANSPEWRVEMANVGRTYYDWRYRSSAPAPALSGEVASSALMVRGWNWGSGTVRVAVSLPGSTGNLAEPQDATPDSSGRLSLVVPMNPAMQGALQAGANVHIEGSTPSASVSLPVGAKLLGGKVKLDGVVTQNAGGQASSSKVHLVGRDGVDYSVALSGATRLLFSEGDVASTGDLRAGVLAEVEGSAVAGIVAAETVRLRSVSRTSAELRAEWSDDGVTLFVTGTRWPGEKQVALSGSSPDGSITPLGSGRSDSRGNLLARTPRSSIKSASSWLTASVSFDNRLIAQAAIDIVDGDVPPSLTLGSNGGEQLGSLGSYCRQGRCRDSLGVPLPAEGGAVVPGASLGLHSQLGNDP